jgi:hypothetical protein
MIRLKDMEIIKITDLFDKIREAVNERENLLKKHYQKKVDETFEYFDRDGTTINNAFQLLDQLYDQINLLTINFNYAKDAAVVGMADRINTIQEKFEGIQRDSDYKKSLNTTLKSSASTIESMPVTVLNFTEINRFVSFIGHVSKN